MVDLCVFVYLVDNGCPDGCVRHRGFTNQNVVQAAGQRVLFLMNNPCGLVFPGTCSMCFCSTLLFWSFILVYLGHRTTEENL